MISRSIRSLVAQMWGFAFDVFSLMCHVMWMPDVQLQTVLLDVLLCWLWELYIPDDCIACEEQS